MPMFIVWFKNDKGFVQRFRIESDDIEQVRAVAAEHIVPSGKEFNVEPEIPHTIGPIIPGVQ